MGSIEDIQFRESKDSIAELHKIVDGLKELSSSLSDELIAERERHEVKEKESDLIIKEMAERIEALETEKANLQEKINYMQRKSFGTSSEKMQIEGQLNLFNEAEQFVDAEEQEPSVPVKPHKRRKKKRTFEESMRGGEFVDDDPIELPEDERICPQCGSEMKPCGKSFVRNRVEVIPAKVVIHRVYVTDYKCRKCARDTDRYEKDEKGDAKKDEEGVPIHLSKPYFKSAIAPPPLFPHSYAGESLVAYCIYWKFALSLTTYRMERDFQSYGTDITRASICRWLIDAAEIYLRPVFDTMLGELRKRKYLMADETRVQVLKEKGRKPQQNSFMWVFRTGEDGGPPIILFQYTQTRHGKYAADFLAGAEGFLETDGFTGYNAVPNIVICYCWAHVRRKFFDAIPPKRKNDLSHPAVQAVTYIDKIFEKDRAIKEDYKDNYDRIKTEREKKERPLIDDFFNWLEKQSTHGTDKWKKAVNYAKNHKEGLYRYLQDGRCSQSNNLSEQMMKDFVIGRKNWLFCDTPSGAESSAIHYSIVQTAKANKLKVFDYVHYILKHRPTKDTPHEELIKLMPWQPDVIESCKIDKE